MIRIRHANGGLRLLTEVTFVLSITRACCITAMLQAFIMDENLAGYWFNVAACNGNQEAYKML